MIDGRRVHGQGRTEIGHMFMWREPGDTDDAGVCPHHGDCLESLASGPAIAARWERTLTDLPSNHEAHTYVAGYLAQLCHTVFASLSLETIILGGGVMQTPGLLDAAKKDVRTRANYLPGMAKQRVVAPGLGQDPRNCGARLLAARAAETENEGEKH